MKCRIASLNERHFLRFFGLTVALFFLGVALAGAARMMPFIASSKLSGGSETGFASRPSYFTDCPGTVPIVCLDDEMAHAITPA